MAEGWLRHLAGHRFQVFSAGTHPVGVNPFAVKVMNEVGIDLRGHRSKSVKEFEGERFDAVITVCDRAKEACPIWPGTIRMLHWSFEDPASAVGSDSEREVVFRNIRDEIAIQIRSFLSEPLRPTEQNSHDSQVCSGRLHDGDASELGLCLHVGGRQRRGRGW
jgi:arsenate reductase